jgi:hypothetical protein
VMLSTNRPQRARKACLRSGPVGELVGMVAHSWG